MAESAFMLHKMRSKATPLIITTAPRDRDIMTGVNPKLRRNHHMFSKAELERLMLYNAKTQVLALSDLLREDAAVRLTQQIATRVQSGLQPVSNCIGQVMDK